jgi:hypothetical protein
LRLRAEVEILLLLVCVCLWRLLELWPPVLVLEIEVM